MSVHASRRTRPTGIAAMPGRLADKIASPYGWLLRQVGRTAFFMRHGIPITTRIDRYLYPRTGGRLTPSSCISSCSVGSRSPGLSRPDLSRANSRSNTAPATVAR